MTGFATCSETTGLLALPIPTAHTIKVSAANTVFCASGGPKMDRIKGPKGVADLVLCTGDPAFSICGGVDVAFGITGGGSICMAEVFPGPQVAVTQTVGGGGGDDFGSSGWVGEVVSPGVNNVGAFTGTVECFSQDLVDAGGISGEVCDDGSFSGAAAVGEQVNLGAGTAETTCVLWSTAGTQTCLPTTTGYEVQETLDPNELQQGYINLSGGVTLPASSFPPTIKITTVPTSGPDWSIPTDIDGSNTINSIACSSTSFSAAVDNVGNALIWNGTSWSSPSRIYNGGNLASVSCSSPTFCVAVDRYGNSTGSGGYTIFNGTSWSSIVEINGGGGLDSVSCPTVDFCAAVGGYVGVQTFNGRTWSTPSHLSLPRGGEVDGNSVSCTSTQFSVAIGTFPPQTVPFIYNGAFWSNEKGILLPGDSEDVSCVTSSRCVLLGFGVNIGVPNPAFVSTYDGISWSEFLLVYIAQILWRRVLRRTVFLHVSGQRWCRVLRGGTWVASTLRETVGQLTAVSCVAVTFCIAVDTKGRAFTYK